MALTNDNTAICRFAESWCSSRLRARSTISVCKESVCGITAPFLYFSRTSQIVYCACATRGRLTIPLYLKTYSFHCKLLKVFHGRENFLVPSRDQAQCSKDFQCCGNVFYVRKKWCVCVTVGRGGRDGGWVGKPSILVLILLVLMLCAMTVIPVGWART